MTHRFWTEGPDRLLEALDEQRVEIDELVAQITRASDSEERARLQQKLRRLIEAYAPSAEEVDQCLFLVT